MRKLPAALENPISNAFINLSEAICPVLRETGHTPNLITFYSASCATLALVSLHHGDMVGFAGLWLLHPFWDTVDGHFARKYGMTSPLGDWLDHTTDVLAVVGLIAVAWQRYDVRKVPWAVMAGLVATLLLFLVHMGCQQKYIGGKGETLDVLQPTCPDSSWARATRWFGHGTLHVLVVAAVLYMEKHCKRHVTAP